MATNNSSNYSPTQYNVQVGGASGTLTNVAPSATSGVPVISQGASANPIFGTVVVAGGGTGATTLTGVLTGNGTSAVTASAVTQHDILVGGASNAITSVAPSATSGVPVISQGASADPVFGTAVVAGGGTGVTTMTTAYAPVCAGTTATGALQVASTGLSTSGFVLTSTGASSLPTFQAIPASGTTWSVITADQTAAVNNGYICNKAGLLTITLPTTAAVGTIIEVSGMNTALGWKIGQNASQQIFFGTSSTTSGTGGSLASSNIYDSVRLICNTANLTWIVLSSVGNITVV